MALLTDAIRAEYTDLCRRIGPWTDWVQGPGGNISIKNETHLIVKASGTLIADAEYVICPIAEPMTVCEGSGRPSIEVYLHTLPSRIIVHLHPAPLLNVLCHAEALPGCTIPYCKPGAELAELLRAAYNPKIQVYFLKNHGIILCGSTSAEIFDLMVQVRNTVFDPKYPTTNIRLVTALYDSIPGPIFIKPHFNIIQSSTPLFYPYTPDTIVFLHEAPLVLGDNTDTCAVLQKYVAKYGHMPTVIYTPNIVYTVGKTLSRCQSIYEILYSYLMIDSSATPLSRDQVAEITGWDAEKERQRLAK